MDRAAGRLDGARRDAGRPDLSRLDVTVAHGARVYDYWLGGKDNFAADRIAAENAIAAWPGIRASVRANRAFLARAVRHLAAAEGVRQFLDIGVGLPAADSTHEVAQAVAPESRIVYVDNDPLVLAHARALLASGPRGATAVVDADLRDAETILARAAALLDLRRPVALLLLSILPELPDAARARAIVARLLEAVPPGSFLVLSHAGSDLLPQEAAAFEKCLNEALPAGRHVARPRADVARFFAGTELLEPGLVPVSQWRPGSALEAGATTTVWGGVGRKVTG